MHYNIVIIGLGNIGLRHLEAILKLEYNISVFLIDTSITALKNSKKLIHEKNINKKNIFLFNTDIAEINTTINCLIVSTTAKVRFGVTNKILSKNKVKNIIFEKVLFNNTTEYKKILQITKKNKINCYVNYPRKYMSAYQELRKDLTNQKIIRIKIYGNNWGLASNIFHFLDIFSYLTNQKEIIFVKNSLHKKTYKNTRKGFIELKGELSFKNSKNHTLVCIDEKNYKENSLQIETENFIYLIDENKKIVNKIFYKNIDKNKIKKFNFLYQSDMTNNYINCIIRKQKLALSTLQNSYDHFKIVMDIINKSYKDNKILIT